MKPTDKLQNIMGSRVTLNPILGGDQNLCGFFLTHEPGNYTQGIDFRSITQATIPICSTPETEVLLVVRPRKLTEIERAEMELKATKNIRIIK